MKIIRWLLSHFFLILLIVIVIYGYMFWGNLAGKDTPAGEALAYLSDEFVEVEEFINAVKAKQAKLSAGKQNMPDKEALAALPEPAPLAVEKRSIEQLPVSISYSHNRMRVKQDSDGKLESTAELPLQAHVEKDRKQANVATKKIPAPVIEISQQTVAEDNPRQMTTSSSATTEEGFVPTNIVRQLNNVDDSGRLRKNSLSGDVIRDKWVTARKSFYLRRYQLSEQNYQQVIDSTTDNFDAYGELGNVYFNQGKMEQATSAYFEAAAILVRTGQIRRAMNLLGILRRLDNEKANDLKKLIDSAVS